MKINFTKKEFSSLLDMLDIADWIITAHKVEDDPRDKPYMDVLQKLYAHAADFGCEEKIKYDKDLNAYFPTNFFEMDSPHRNYISEYDENIFWGDLIDRLATRDSIDEIGEEAFYDSDRSKQFSAMCKHEEKWANEFSEHHLKNISIKK